VSDALLEVFEAQRPRLFGIAYRMLGSAAEAEDMVQNAWLRWQGADRDAVAEPAAFLTTVVTRLCLNELDSARVRRESYVGPWLPEPVSTAHDPLIGAERAEALSLAVLLLLERLSPAERAAYVLHEAFDYPYQRIAEVLEVSEVNARQLGARARAHLARERGAEVGAAEHSRLLAAFVAAAQSGDLEALESVLADDVVSLSDGGGVVSAARNPVRGRARVAQLVRGVLAKFGQGVDVAQVEANGDAAMLGTRDGHPIALWTVDIGPEGVRRLMVIMTPEKLERFAAAVASG
jgi:RNA polymerase sigma-70 factor (ECF subfamily)